MSSEKDPKRRRRGRKSTEGKHVEETQRAEKLVGDKDESKEVNVQAHKSLLLQLEGETWFNYAKTLPGWNATFESAASVDGTKQIYNAPSVVAKYRAMADLIYQKEIELFTKNTPRGSDERWVENTMKRGTLKDRIAAMSVTVSADPVHKFHVLDGLLHMAGCSAEGASGGGGGAAGQTNSRVAQMTAEALEDLFLNIFLLSDRKLISMDQRPLYLYENTTQDGGGNQKKTAQKTLSPRILLLWRFEERIKEKYSLFLRRYMAHTLHEGVETHKIATLRLAATMLRSVPEGESQLLSMMVNKLGDPVKKAASAAGHELRRVLRQHPAMQIVIAREVQQLSHRPHLSSRAQYNCIVFLNQLKLDKEDEEGDQKKKAKSNGSSSAARGGDASLAASLIKTYFRFFEVAVTNTKVKKGKSDSPSSDDAGVKSRLLSALL
jgi:ribosome biogenesis protein MAK21